MGDASTKTPVLLMVSGGSDSTALLELACTYVEEGAGDETNADVLLRMMAAALPAREHVELFILHVNHLLRGEASDADECFVRERCGELGLPLEVQHVDIARLVRDSRGGMEAVARAERYRLADAALAHAAASMGARPDDGIILTAHTLDDRIETFCMRMLVGTGPGGLGSIPRVRGKVRRPLLDATREQLRDWLRTRHPGMPDERLWREDETNYTGNNFRTQVRMRLMPVLRELRPGFEGILAQSMDLIAEENEALQQEAESVVYRSLDWNGEMARLPIEALQRLNRPMARRVMRNCLLVVNPDARLESRQIDRVLDGMQEEGFTTEVSGGMRVSSNGTELLLFKAQ